VEAGRPRRAWVAVQGNAAASCWGVSGPVMMGEEACEVLGRLCQPASVGASVCQRKSAREGNPAGENGQAWQVR